MTDELPVSRCLSDIVRAVADQHPVVLKAPPGAGKTTGVPPALLADARVGDGQTILVQPRRLAARSAATRLAQIMGCKLGERVGYQVRFDRRAGKQTQLLVVTTGILLRRLQTDPLLEDVSCVILDEFHERSLEIDLALGMIERIRTTLRPELNLIVMSATLDPKPIVDFLDRAVAIESTGREYPVDVQYVEQSSRDFVDRQVADALPSVLRQTDGHVLVFLPGVGEIRRTAQRLEASNAFGDAEVMQLFGDLSPQDQDAVIAPGKIRKVILSTNVAETSITIPGVTGVIDSGTARVMRYEPNVGLSALRIEKISQASADQRTGRAGRTEPGVCLRLWPSATHRSRRQMDSPEIERADFSSAALMLAAWGERDAMSFPWLTPPPSAAVDSALGLLAKLDAITSDRTLTSLGKQILSLPVHPRIGRFIIAAKQYDVTEAASLAAALLTERDPFRIPDRNQRPSIDRHARPSDSDVIDRVESLQAYFAGDRRREIHTPAAKQVRRVSQQLQQTAESIEIDVDESIRDAMPERDRLRLALLKAFPDRLARRRQPGSDRGVMVGGRGVKVDRQSNVQSAEFFLCIDVDGKGSEAIVRSASAIDADWLDGKHVRKVDESFFVPSSQSVATRRRRYFDDLMLGESPIESKPGGEVASILFENAKRDRDRLLPQKDVEISQFIQRVRFLVRHMPELELSDLDDVAMNEVLGELCQSRTSFAQLRTAPWLDHLQGRYGYEMLQSIQLHAPPRMTVPSGNAISIRYADGKPPVLAVRLQEIFGWQSTPTVAGGRVRVQLHLLGPNHRPQQITEDLENFWSSTYDQVRKDLRRRYPKHHWPEDPKVAKATRNGLKPKK